MKLDRKILRKLILQEIRLLSEDYADEALLNDYELIMHSAAAMY